MIIESNYNAGDHIVHWNGKDQSSGLYIVKMDSGNFSNSQFITLVK